MSTFFDRMDDLSEQVGRGELHGQVNFDQVYARYVDGTGDLGDDTGVITPTEISHGPHGKPGPTFDHPRGGQAGYLTGTLTEKGAEVAQQWADSIGEERPLDTVAITQVEAVAAEAAIRAPREFWLLTGSGSTEVQSDGAVIYEREAPVPRAAEGLLKDLVRTAEEEDVVHRNSNRRRDSPLSPGIVRQFGGGVADGSPPG